MHFSKLLPVNQRRGDPQNIPNMAITNDVFRAAASDADAFVPVITFKVNTFTPMKIKVYSTYSYSFQFISIQY